MVKKSGKDICQKQIREKRRWWWWDDTDRGSRPSRSPQNTILTTHAIWLFTSLSGGLNQSFCFFLDGGTKPLHHEKDIDHLIVVLRFFRNLIFSCPFLHLCFSITPTLLHIVSNHRIILFQWILFHSKTLQGCVHFAPVVWQILSFRIVVPVLHPSHVGHKLEPCVVITHMLFVVDESRGDSICHLACLLFQVMELLFRKFLFFWHDLPWIFDTDHLILWVQLLRLKLPNLSANLLPRLEWRG